MDAYERLLGDAMAGDATLFARQDVVEAAWAIVDPVIHGPSPMYEYEPGTWGPPQADRLVGRRRRLEHTQMKVLVIDVGGTNIKVSMGGPDDPLKIPSGAELTAASGWRPR